MNFCSYSQYNTFNEWSMRGETPGIGLSNNFVFVNEGKDTISVYKSTNLNFEYLYVNHAYYWNCHLEYKMNELLRGESVLYKCENCHVTRVCDRYIFADSIAEYVFIFMNIDNNSTNAEMLSSVKLLIERDKPTIIKYTTQEFRYGEYPIISISTLKKPLTHEQALSRFYSEYKSRNIKRENGKVEIGESNNYYFWKWRRNDIDSLRITSMGYYNLTPYYEVLYETVLDRLGYDPC